MNGLKDLLSVLTPFLLGIFTTWLSDKRTNKQENHNFLLEDYQAVKNENKELRKENERLRKELEQYDSK